MPDEEQLRWMDKWGRWADDVLDEWARVSEHLSDAELEDRVAIEQAELFMLADGWVIGPPGDPELRRFLIENELMTPDFADRVIAKMGELDATDNNAR